MAMSGFGGKAYRAPQPFSQKVAPRRNLGPEHNPWWWNPNNPSITFAPKRFTARLKREMGSELEVTWNPITERWQVFARSNRINHPVCQGWRLLFIHNGPNGEHLPLDERLYARLYAASADVNGSGRQYFQRIMDEMKRDEDRREKRARQDAIDQAMPYWEHSQIKNIGKGSKFSTYHA